MAEEKKYKFSIIVAAENNGDHLAETIESLVGQTLDFETDMELILVLAKDSIAAAEVSSRYISQFPKNIVSVSYSDSIGTALNQATNSAKGEYLSYMRAGDRLSARCLEEVYPYAVAHKDRIDLVAVRSTEEAATSIFNAKFSRTHIIKIGGRLEDVRTDIAATFIRKTALGVYPFGNYGSYCNDTEVVTRVILQKQAYGVVARALYNSHFSAAERADQRYHFKPWYDEAVESLGRIVAISGAAPMKTYCQQVVMADLQKRLKQTDQTTLSKAEVAQYKTKLFGLLKNIDDSIILSHPSLGAEYGVFLLGKKYGKRIVNSMRQEGKKFFYGTELLYDYDKKDPIVHFDLMEVANGKLRIEGFFGGLLLNRARLTFVVNGREYDVEEVDRPLKHTIFLGETVYTRHCFLIDIPLEGKAKIGARVRLANGYKNLHFSVRRNIPLNRFCNYSYWISKGFVVIKREDHTLEARPYKKYSRVLYATTYYLYLLRRLKLKLAKESLVLHKKKVKVGLQSTPKKELAKDSIKELRWLLVPVKSTLQNLETIVIRLLYFVVKPFVRKKIWLISDRVDLAGDNGEAFFRYVTSHPEASIKPYFVIARSSKDFKRMQQYGNVIGWTGLRYKLLFLRADKVISSHASDFVTNPFALRRSDFSDLIDYDFIFLQHGIIYNDLSRWLNRYNQNIDMFVTSVKQEYDSILSYHYSYDKSVVKLTGIPRYDLLENKPRRKLVLAPTWRTNLTGPIDMKTAIRAYNKKFKDSEYYTFYQGLIDDERIRAALKKNDMVGELYLHLSLGTQLEDFNGNEQFHIKQMPYDYKTAFSEGNIMVTDYSSIQFDFAYLKKPVIYTQFDKQTFYEGQNYDPGYFSFEKNGFGPVVYDYESAVREIVKAIESGGVLEKKYQKRIETFFYKFDKKNSERVYKEIKKINTRKAR